VFGIGFLHTAPAWQGQSKLDSFCGASFRDEICT
jgi:hypothetical protein